MEKCELYESCRENREKEIAFRASLEEQMKSAVKELLDIATTIKGNNEKHWEAIGKVQEAIQQESKDRISADGHIESKISFERGKFVGYAILISAIITVGGIILSKVI